MVVLSFIFVILVCCLTCCSGLGQKQPSRMYHRSHDMISGRWAPYAKIAARGRLECLASCMTDEAKSASCNAIRFGDDGICEKSKLTSLYKPDGSAVFEIYIESEAFKHLEVASCLSGWSEFQSSCYQLLLTSLTGVTWETAESTCNSLGSSTNKAHSVSIQTEEENNFLDTLVLTPENDYHIWTGGFRKPEDGGTLPWTGLWRWTDGSEWTFDNDLLSTVNNTFGNEYAVFRKPHGGWRDNQKSFYKTSSYVMYPLCEYKL